MSDRALTQSQVRPPASAPVSGGLLRRKCDCGSRAGVGAPCAECAKNRDGARLQRSAVGNRPTNEVPPIVHDVLRSAGQPLDPATRSFFEPRFAHDFSHVRVHTDARAAYSARAVNALAYTVGRHVVFGASRHPLHTASGKNLMAHELTHVVQQDASSGGGALRIDAAEDSTSEREAERAEQALATGASTGGFGMPIRSSSRALKRKVLPEHVSCRQTGVEEFGLTGDDAVAAIQAADEEAVGLATGAETLLRDRLALAREGEHPSQTVTQEQDPRDPRRPLREPVTTEVDTILEEELGLSLTNPAHFSLIQQQIGRFRRVRETLESGYLHYLCRAMGHVSLVGCSAGESPCTGDRASGFSCPGNRLVGLCRPFWFDEFARARTILHEPFHIWFEMARHAPNALKRADASCFEAFALRVAGQIPWRSCADHTAG